MVDEHVENVETTDEEVVEETVEETTETVTTLPAKSGKRGNDDEAFARIKRDRDRLKQELADTKTQLNDALAKAQNTTEIEAAKAESDAKINKLLMLSEAGLSLDWVENIPVNDEAGIKEAIERIKARIPAVSTTTTREPSEEEPEEENTQTTTTVTHRRPPPKGTTVKPDVANMTPAERVKYFSNKL